LLPIYINFDSARILLKDINEDQHPGDRNGLSDLLRMMTEAEIPDPDTKIRISALGDQLQQTKACSYSDLDMILKELTEPLNKHVVFLIDGLDNWYVSGDEELRKNAKNLLFSLSEHVKDHRASVILAHKTTSNWEGDYLVKPLPALTYRESRFLDETKRKLKIIKPIFYPFF